MKSIKALIVVLVFAVGTFAFAGKADCCKPGAKCCKPGASCCAKYK